MWGDCDGQKVLSHKYGKGIIYWGKTVKQVLEEIRVAPDVEFIGVDNTDGHIDYLHRQTKREEIYFVSNSKPETEKLTCVFRVDKEMIPELWDAETGLVQHNVKYSKVKNGISIELVLDPLASRFVVFKIKTGERYGDDNGPGYDLQFGFNQSRTQDQKNKTLDISYNWNIKFNPEMGGPASYHLDSLVSWNEIKEEGIKYYSGSASYETDFTVNEKDIINGHKAFVVFDNIEEMARVFVNGKDCGIVWTLPYKAEITKHLKAGTNHIVVQVINTWNNRIVGDVSAPDKKQYTKTNIKYKMKPTSPLLKSGLIGKAQIIFQRK
jgi:hypothetical protein